MLPKMQLVFKTQIIFYNYWTNMIFNNIKFESGIKENKALSLNQIARKNLNGYDIRKKFTWKCNTGLKVVLRRSIPGIHLIYSGPQFNSLPKPLQEYIENTRKKNQNKKLRTCLADKKKQILTKDKLPQ